MQHLDSAQVAFLLRELESLDKQAYETLLPGNLAMTYIPLQQGVAEWQDVYTYKMYTKTGGKAPRGGKNADNLKRAGVVMTPATRRIEQFPLSYGWTVREIQQAAATGVPLDSLTVMAARTMAARSIDDYLALGNGSDILGLLSQSTIFIESPTTKTGGAPWVTPGNLPDEVLADINKMTENLIKGLKQTETPGFNRFTFLVPTIQYTYLATTPRSTLSDTTVLKFAIANNPWVESIEPWWQCDGAGGSGADRVVAYPRNPLAVSALVPQEFRPLSPQERDLEIVVPATASCGGTIVRYPVACRYMDGV
jgi:hypothetical protein